MWSNIEWGPVGLHFLYGLIAGGIFWQLWLLVRLNRIHGADVAEISKILGQQVELDGLILDRLDMMLGRVSTGGMTDRIHLSDEEFEAKLTPGTWKHDLWLKMQKSKALRDEIRREVEGQPASEKPDGASYKNPSEA